MRKFLKCDHGDYTSTEIGAAHGLPPQLVSKAIHWHEIANKGHRVSIVEEPAQ